MAAAEDLNYYGLTAACRKEYGPVFRDFIAHLDANFDASTSPERIPKDLLIDANIAEFLRFKWGDGIPTGSFKKYRAALQAAHQGEELGQIDWDDSAKFPHTWRVMKAIKNSEAYKDHVPEQAKTFDKSLVLRAMHFKPADKIGRQGKAIFVLGLFASLRMDDVRNLQQSDIKVLTDLRSFELNIHKDKSHQQRSLKPVKQPNIACECSQQALTDAALPAGRAKAFRKLVAANPESTPCLYDECPFEAVRVYRHALFTDLGQGMADTQHPLMIKINSSRTNSSIQTFDQGYAVVGVNTLPQKQKYFLDAVAAAHLDAVAASNASGSVSGAAAMGTSSTTNTQKRKSAYTGHSARNTAITFAMSAGVTESNIAVSSGHVDVNTLRAYAEPTMETKTSLSLGVARQLRQHQDQNELRERILRDDDIEDDAVEARKRARPAVASSSKAAAGRDRGAREDEDGDERDDKEDSMVQKAVGGNVYQFFFR
jgi:hypothetical protein